MSCQLTLVALLRDALTVRGYLFPHLKDHDKTGQESAEGWDDADWGWKDESEKTEETDDQPKEAINSWLQECEVSVSPTSELIAVAHENKLVLLSQKWDAAEEDEVAYKYTTVYEDSITQEAGEKIRSVLCLPLASQKRSTHGGPDWTCVIVGFTSGWVRIYTENGTLMLSQIFSEEPVTKIKCRTYEPPRFASDAEKHEEIAILYRKALVTIDGFSFFQSLRACRNQVARAAASGSEQISPPPLAYKKWALQEQDTVNDHVTCGLVTPNPFDQMQTASILGGYKATIKPTPPACHQYITSGIAPYIGFYYAIEGSAQPMLSDVAHAVASKLKSALFSQISAASGWFGLGGRQSSEMRQEKRPKIEPATALPSRFGLPDKRRHGESVLLSPDNRLAAVTDSFGRVMLIDVQRGVAVRMWKGYRDAQVGWVEVKEDTPTDNPITQRHALFLIIYAPRRGILEVWTAQQGPRVAAFNVSKWCRLVCPGYGLMGLNNVTCRDVKVPLFSCYLIDPAAATVRTIDVPFHLALSDKNSKRARDLHLLKKLKVALKEGTEATGSLQSEVIDMLLEMKIASIRQQGLEKVLHTKHLPAPFLQAVIAALLDHLNTQAQEAEEAEGGSLDYESRMLSQFCQVEATLLSAYVEQEKRNQAESHVMALKNREEIALCLGLTVDEVLSLETQTLTYHSLANAGPRVKFAADTTMSAVDFISCFSCQLQHKEKSETPLGPNHIVGKPGAFGALGTIAGGGVNEEGGTNKDDGGGVTDGVQDKSRPEDATSKEEEAAASKTAGLADSITGGLPGSNGGVSSGSRSGGSMELTVQLKKGLTEARKLKLANFLFQKVLNDGEQEDFDKVIDQSSIPPDNLLALLVHLWLSEDPKDLQTAVNLRALIRAISKNKEEDQVAVNHNSISPWWQTLRDMCTHSENIVAALVAALVSRTVAGEMAGKLGERDGDMTGSAASTDSHDLSSWESVTLDRTQWTVLVKQLEDLLALQCLLQLRPTSRFAAAMVTGEQDPITVSVKKVLDGGRGVLPELVAKWIAGQAIPPSMLCLTNPLDDASPTVVEAGEEVTESKKLEQTNPIVDQLQAIQRRLPHSLDADVLMANCAWEYVLIWNRDPEVVFLLQQAVAYLRCIQNAAIQHGVAAMMWQMFVVKKVSAAALLIEKVGKSPKERLCRRDVGVSDSSLEKFLGVTVDLLDTLIQASQELRVVPVLNTEDLWGGISGPTSLVELALEQKDSTHDLVQHHYNLCVILHAVMAFSMRSVKPLSLFDTKGRNAFFKPIHTNPVLPSQVVDDSLIRMRQQFLCKVLTNAVLLLTDAPLPLSASTSASSTPATTPSIEKQPTALGERSPEKTARPTGTVASCLGESGLPSPSSPAPGSSPSQASSLYSRWPPLVLALGPPLSVDVDILRRHHVCELYSSSLDKLAEEVLLTVNDHTIIGSQLILIAGQRLARSIFTGDAAASVDKLSNCPPTVSTWLRSLDPSQLRSPDVPLRDTATLIGQVVNQLPEGHSEYNMAISLVELVQSLM